MLRVRPHTSIFQQIILPYWTSTVPARAPTSTNVADSAGQRDSRRLQRQTRSFSSSEPRCKPTDTATDVLSSRIAVWEPYTPQPSSSSSRLRTREYLGLGDGEREARRTDAGKEEERESESYRRTTALALDRIIKGHKPPPTSSTKRDKGKQVDRDPEGTSNDASNAGAMSTRADTSNNAISSKPISREANHKKSEVDLNPDLEIDDRPFPPLIHQLLQARQFRLTTLHILNSSSYALDPFFVERVARFMDRHHGQNAARRLRKGKIPSAEDRSLMTQGGLDATSPPVRLGFISPTSLEDMDDRILGIKTNRQEQLTAFYNAQLAHRLSSSYLPKGLLPPKSLPRPNTSLRQLRSLLAKIHKLESCRGFVPDRVTANIILGCWVRCALASGPDGSRVVKTRDKGWKISPRHTSSHRGFGGEELGNLFGLVSSLFDRAAGIAAVTTTTTTTTSSSSSSPDSPSPSPLDTDDPDTATTLTNTAISKAGQDDVVAVVGDEVDPRVDYGRHIKPFVKIFQHGYKQRKDLARLDALREWDRRIRAALHKRRSSTGMREGEGDLD